LQANLGVQRWANFALHLEGFGGGIFCREVAFEQAAEKLDVALDFGCGEILGGAALQRCNSRRVSSTALAAEGAEGAAAWNATFPQPVRACGSSLVAAIFPGTPGRRFQLSDL
jgi:hypothetical protein